MARNTAKPGQPSQLKSPQKSHTGIRKNRRRQAKPLRIKKSKSAATYDYAPLQHADSIRLLTLHPGEFASPIQVSLNEVRSQDDHMYQALSYTWATEDGDCKRSRQIKCHDMRIWVTRNCELALRYLRKEDSDRVLWVDAICINQKDDKERGHQVRLMRNVYSKAVEVLVWLGESSKDVGILDPVHYLHGKTRSAENKPDVNRVLTPVSDIFLDHLHRMAAEIRRIQNAGQNPTSSPLYQDLVSQIYEGSFQRTNTDLFRGFKNVVRRRWWSRVWVVQEVAIAKSATLICSERSINYTEFFDWCVLLGKDHSPKAFRARNKLFRVLSHFGAVSQAQHERSTILEVLLWARRLTASDPRDAIFGFLGLSDKFKSSLPLPNYSDSTTQVFTNVAKALLKQTKSLSFLEHATSTTHVFGHPSWVPYWSNPPVIWNWLGDGSLKPSRNSEAIFAISSDDQELLVKGRKFDSVKRAPPASLRASGTTLSDVQIWEGSRVSCHIGFSLTNYPTGEPVEDVLWRTLSWNTCNNFSPLKMREDFRAWYRILASTDTPTKYREQIHAQGVDAFEIYINMTSLLCTTINGYLAAVPYTTEVGDYIVVLAGGDVPFVLRPTGDHYHLIGPCYVHGVMNGEAFPDNPDTLEWFSIH
ncbi:HET-domain-containing protein [Stipitochalara longipes BDJ]|nr:HET-domain-containing protein [Stipitochalara longipes BDJ]